MPEVGQLRSCGLVKESVLGTIIDTPTRYLRFYPPDSFFPKVEPLISGAVGVLPDKNIKQTPGPGTLDGMKVKLDLEPENIGEILHALFGSDTAAEDASFVVTLNTNDFIDLKEDGGTELNAQIAAGIYKMGTSSSDAGSLLAALKTALEAAGAGTYTLTYSYTTRKISVAVSGGASAIQFLFATGTNVAKSAATLLGFTAADTSSTSPLISNSTTAVAPFTHTFARQAVAQLPTYSFWFDKKPQYPLFGGCMLNKLDIEIKAKELVSAEAEFVGTTYDGSTGTSKSPTFSAVRPFSSFMASISIDGSTSVDIVSAKLSIMNNVKADHVIRSDTRYPSKIYSEGFEVELAAELFFEDLTQYNKFLAGSTAAFIITLNHVDDVSGAATGEKYSLVINLPSLVYKAANLPIPTGVLKVPFMATAMYDTSTSKTINAVLKNGLSAAY